MRDIQYRDEGRPEDLLQELGYETQDIAYKKFATYIAYFFGFFIACIIAGFFIMLWMTKTGWKGGRMADYIPKVTPPVSTPLLQSNITARTDIRSLRMKETAQMDTPAVVDQAHGVYRIPIDQAIDDVANGADSDRATMGLPPTKANQSSAPATVNMSFHTDAKGNPVLDMSQGDETLRMHLKASNAAAQKPTDTVRGGRRPRSNSNANASRGESATAKPKGGNGG